jgi:enterochelin esterase-like enzyme
MKHMHRPRGCVIAVMLLVGAGAWAMSQEAPGVDSLKPGPVSLGLQIGPAEACQPAPPAPPAPVPGGVCVLGARSNGAAERAGLEIGDTIYQLGGAAIANAADLLNLVRALKVGDRPQALVWRQGRQLTLEIEITAEDVAAATSGWTSSAMAARPQAPYKILSLPVDPASLVKSVDNIDTAVWVDKDLLNIVHRDPRESVRISGSLQLPMLRVPGTDVWILQLEMKGWESAFFSYEFLATGANDGVVAPVANFRGSQAAELPQMLETLQGSLFERTIYSRFLNEARKITVYVPSGAKRRRLPVLFMADGASTGGFARSLEPLMLAGHAASFAIVGIHSPASDWVPGEAIDVIRDRRSQEYLSGVSPEAYARHMSFFIEEVVPWASREYDVSSARRNRAVFGFSSGAAFAVAAAAQHPEVFANALAFSIGYSQLPASGSGLLPRFLLIAGELEPDFVANTRIVRDILAGWGAEVSFNVYLSGHDPLMWQTGLCHVIPRVFPSPRRKSASSSRADHILRVAFPKTSRPVRAQADCNARHCATRAALEGLPL